MGETDDRLFYAQPRLAVYIDDHAISAIRSYLTDPLPQTGVALDLMSSWRSHMPEDGRDLEVVGLGMNADGRKLFTRRLIAVAERRSMNVHEGGKPIR